MKNKKDYIYNKLSSEKIDICALQEVEIQHGYDCNLLSSKDYRLEVEKVSGKARIATAIKNNIDYTRRNDLEKEDSSVIIIDLNSNPKLRLINIYRSFNPPKNKNALTAFKEQIEIIKSSLLNCNQYQPIILGDFNLDYECKNLITYRFKNYFDILEELTDQFNLMQMISNPT